MKKINLKIFLIILITAICILFPKDVMATDYPFYKKGDKTLKGIFIRMREDLKSKSNEWLDSTPDSLNEPEIEWGGEGGAITALSEKGLLLDQEKGSNTPSAMIHAVGALCFGHSTKGSGDSVKIKTININYNSSKSELKLAYLVGKSIEEREIHNSNTYKNMIRRWLWNNSSKYSIKIQSKNDANSSYDIDEVNSYANKIDKRKLALKVYATTGTNGTNLYYEYETDSNGNQKLKDTWSYIGPIKVKCDNNHPITDAKLKMTDGSYIDLKYYSDFSDGVGGERKEFSDGLTTGGKYKKIYVVKKTENITGGTVAGVKIIQPVTYYKAKIVLSQPTGSGGQNICIFYGKEVTENAEKEKPLEDNEDTYSIEINKVNDKGDTLSNVGFVVRKTGSDWTEYINGYNEATGTVTYGKKNVNYIPEENYNYKSTDKKMKIPGWGSDVYVFKTNNRGRITIDGIGEQQAFAIYEVYNPYEEYRNVSNSSITDRDRIWLAHPGDLSNKNMISSSTADGVTTIEARTPNGTEYTNEVEDNKSTVTVKNKIEYIDVSGNVWEDGIEGKTSRINNYYDGGSADEELAYVRVRLKNNRGVIVQQTITNSSGYYSFSKVPINQLSNYYIEFEYNGMSYQSLGTVDYTKNNTSKASEGTTTRTNFNNKFQTIIKNNAQGSAGNINLSYNYYNHKSTLVYGTRATKGYNTAQYPVSGVYWDSTTGTYKDGGLQNDFIITAITPTLAYLKDQNPETKGELYLQTRSIDNINLGLYVREQPDLAIIEDVDNIKLEVNGYEHTYNYDKRPIDVNFMNGENTTDASAYFKNKYLSKSYNRDIYKSDIAYSMDSSTTDEDKLKVYITYKLSVRNEADYITAKINELYSYYDTRYKLVSLKDKDGKEITARTEDYSGSGITYVNHEVAYGQLRIQNIDVNPNSVCNIYITYQLTNNAINSILEENMTVNTVSEITSYSSTRNGNVYGGIDIDSAPDNYFGDINKYAVLDNNFTSKKDKTEDDSDEAPPIVLTASKNRVIEGSVWEDNAQESLLNSSTMKQRVGDGIYDDNENVVGNVKVELLEKTGEIAAVYPFIEGSYAPSEATTQTINEGNNKGTYRFEGIIPGEYYIRYTYGNQSVIYDKDGNEVGNVKAEKYKSTTYKYDSSVYWYKDSKERNSDARDTIGIYQDNSSCNIVEKRTTPSEITYAIAIYESTLKDIQAETASMEIKLDDNIEDDIEDDSNTSDGIEANRYIYNNVDFGIIERPKQNLIVKKEISNIEIVLANGQTIIKGDPRTGNINYLKMLPDGKVYIEIDNEIIQGATLNIDYEIIADSTNCEYDYNNVNYYYYYDIPNDADPQYQRRVPIIEQLYDYPSEGLNVNDDNEGVWQEVEITEELRNSGYLSIGTYEVAKEYKTVLMTEAFKDLIPGETKSVTMRLSRLLSNNEMDFDFENDVEVIKLQNSKIEDSIPGNYVPGTSVHENDSASTNLIITGPTGENMNYAYYIGIGVLSLTIIGIGIVLIKKRVLKKEK